MNNILYILIYLFSVFISSFAQILLKKSAMVKYPTPFREYFNKFVISGYTIFVFATGLTMIAYRGVELSFGPLLEASGFIFVAIFSSLFLKEKIKRNQIIGIFLIIFGIAVFVL